MTNKAFLVDANGQVLKGTGKTLSSTTGALGGPSTENADRALTAADADSVLVCASARSFTVNVGMPTAFGPAAVGVGVVTWVAGSGVSINDYRTTGATNPSCCLVQIGQDIYNVVGSKA